MNATKPKTSVRKKPIIALVIVLAVIIGLFAAATAVTSHYMNLNFKRGEYSDPRLITDYYYEHYANEYPRVEVSFKSGENTLLGFIYGADNDKALLVFAHGIGCGHEDYMKNLIWFVDKGYRVFAYDATGSGHSEGDGTRGLPQSALDLDAALTYAESDGRLSGLPVFLMGHSWGGYAVTAVLNFDHDIKGVASVSGYSEPVEMIYEFASGVVGNARPLLYPSIWLYNKLLFGEYAGLSAVKGINKSNVPVLIFHGTDDETIGYNESSIMNKREKITNPNVEYITLPGCSHSGMFYTKEALEYKDDFRAGYRKLFDEYGGEFPEEKQLEYYSAADRELVNQPNTELLEKILEFYEGNL